MSAIRLINPSSRHLRQVARHEAGHVAAAHLLGWTPLEATLSSDNDGHCEHAAPDGLSRSLLLEQRAIILYAAAAYARSDPVRGGDLGDGDDRVQAWHAVRELAKRDRLPFDFLRARLQRRADELAASREFDWIASYVADALLQRGRRGADELRGLIEDALHDCKARRLRTTDT